MRHRFFNLPNNLLISHIVIKWQPFQNLEWIVNLIDRKDRMNEVVKLKGETTSEIVLAVHKKF